MAPTPTTTRTCHTCTKCLFLQRRLTRIETEYDYLRNYFLSEVKPPAHRFRGISKEDKEICEEVERVKLTLDTMFRSQLFELKEL